MFTAPLLHGDLVHIAANSVALLMVGYWLERLVGRAWLLALFIVGALGGVLASLVVNSDKVVSVGASGAIMGLFAALLVCSFRFPPDTNARLRLQRRALRILIPSLLPLASGATAAHIDYGAHIGGALASGFVAMFLLDAWQDTERLPPARALAAIIAVIGVILSGASMAAIAAHFDEYNASIPPTPQSQSPQAQNDRVRHLCELSSRDERVRNLLKDRNLCD